MNLLHLDLLTDRHDDADNMGENDNQLLSNIWRNHQEQSSLDDKEKKLQEAQKHIERARKSIDGARAGIVKFDPLD